MGFRQVLVVAMLMILFLVPNVVMGDPIGNPNDRLIIEGAHIVSEGAYFRFSVKNNYSQPIYVTMNDSDTFYILPYDSINYNVIAPRVSVPYEKITYTFKLHLLLSDPNYVSNKFDFTVLVLNSSFVQVFDIIVPFLIILAIALVVAISVFMIRRRRISSKSALTIRKEA
jgi:hypothetical protein